MMNGYNPASFDWDDGPLIKAWNKMDKKRQTKKNPKANKKRKWKIGDCCQALYSVDNLYYEARIIDVNGDFCTVRFYGYDDQEDKDFTQLKESAGEEARKQQIVDAMYDAPDDKSSAPDNKSSVDESEDTTEETDVRTSRKTNRGNKLPNNASMHETTYVQPQYPASNAACYEPPPSLPFNHPMPPPVPMPYHSMPPPLPQIPSLGEDPALSAAIVAWYMAGYYTGLYAGQNQTTEHQSCCSCSHRH